MRGIWQRGAGGTLAAVLALGGAAVASGASGVLYKGRTSQKQKVGFRLSAREVTRFTIVILDKCPDGHLLHVTAHYPPMVVKNGKFGGRFRPVHGRPGEKASLTAKLRHRTATGTLEDIAFSSRERALCYGRARFSIHRA